MCISSISSVSRFTSSIATKKHAVSKLLYAQGNPPDYAITDPW